MTKKLMVVDGNSIMNRAFYGLQGSQLLSTSDGLYTNAIYGFLNILFKYMDEERPDYICIGFDLKAPTFRHVEFEGYKAHRKGMPSELRVQVPVLKEVIDAMNIKRIEVEGYEADDILGTVSKYCESKGIETVIVTGDRDSFQLISEKTRVKIPLTRGGKTETQEYTLQRFVDTYGIQPKQFIDVKGIMGDASDNIPGVPGVGEKTALELVKQYGNIEKILDNADELNIRKNIKENIINNKEQAVLSKRLATIECDIPMDINLNEYEVKEYDKSKLYELFKRLEFNSYIEKLALVGDVKKVDAKVKVIDEENITQIIDKLNSQKKLIYALHYDIHHKYKVLGIGIYFSDEILFINNSLTNNDILSRFKDIFENISIKKIGYNLKRDIVALNNYGIAFNGISFDIMIAAYLINPSRDTYQLSSIVQEQMGLCILSDTEFWGKGRKTNQIEAFSIDDSANFIGNQVDCINRVVPLLEKKLKENQQDKLFYEIELPLIEVLASMEIVGFKVDKSQLESLSLELEGKVTLLTNEIFSLADEQFNINSTRQLGTILFDKLKLPIVKKTKTGYSTDAEVLEILQSQHEIIKKILEYRQLVKLKSTYAEGLIGVINPISGKIHSSFNQTVTQTGRISSTEPNLQNIPIKLEMGRKFRKVFTSSSEEYTLLDADYSQIELRVLAHIAEDKNMIEAFNKNEDIHRRTASEVFNVPMDEVTTTMRSRAKAVNFGIVYGIGDFSLARDLGITRKEAKKYIQNYLDNFTGVKKYMQEIVEIGKIKGYVTTLLNRRRYLPELKSSNFNIRSFGERIAMNTPIQGTAADIIKIAMVNVYKELKERKLKSKIILQVHDELIVEVHKDEVDVVKDIVQDKMTNAIQLNVPLVIDMNLGYSWYDAK